MYVPDNDGRVYALDADTGDEIWHTQDPLGSSIWNAVAAADGKIYTCSNNPGKFNCLDAFTGEIIWQYTFNATHSYSSPAVAYGNVYFGSSGDGYLYAFGAPNEPPETPTKPDGPDNGLTYVEYMFNSSTTDSEGDDIYYLFDWGDGNYSDWIGPYSSGEECSASHIWTEIGIYEIRVRAHDGKRKGNWSEPLTFYATSLPPDAPSINGPTTGKKGVSYNFTFNSIDPEEEDVYYYIKWGDGCIDDWNGPHASGVDFVVAHSYPTSKTFIIEAKAKDITGAESDWAEFTIIIPRDKAINNPLLNFLQSHPNIFPLLQKQIQQLGFGM